ncbi:MAG TPA: FAD:protein FMN transferase [Gaiellaceae bacterium]|nr:FAD:protein FMN transferase [Gaiellaceae bacterium]
MSEPYRFRAMGCAVVVGGATATEARQIRQLFARRDRAFSRFRQNSELNAVNAADDSSLVSELFATTLARALEAAAATDGLVDPTLGASIVAAGYDRDFLDLADGRPATSNGSRPGCWKNVRLTGRLVRCPTGTHLDLNGVVKALAVDDAVRLLSGPGFVSAGGDLAANAPIDVALPGGGAVRVVQGGIATSGRAARRWLRDGEEQHHLIDPRSGKPARSPWTHVTVVGADCLAADVAAKAAFLLGADGPEWLARRGLPGRFLASNVVVTNGVWDSALERERACT